MKKVSINAHPGPQSSPRYVAFQQGRRIAEGSENEIAAQLAARLTAQARPTARSSTPSSPPSSEPSSAPSEALAVTLIFDLATGEQIELPPLPVTVPVIPDSPSRPGRPKLGVVAREVTLLPRDWEWLNQQPGGASVTLRKLVLKAQRASEGADRRRQAQVVCYRFITAIAGNELGFEEATRALFTHQPDRFETHTATWPADVREHALRLAAMAFEPVTPTSAEVGDAGQTGEKGQTGNSVNAPTPQSEVSA